MLLIKFPTILKFRIIHPSHVSYLVSFIYIFFNFFHFSGFAGGDRSQTVRNLVAALTSPQVAPDFQQLSSAEQATLADLLEIENVPVSQFILSLMVLVYLNVS